MIYGMQEGAQLVIASQGRVPNVDVDATGEEPNE
jgi:hypothetical protein